MSPDDPDRVDVDPMLLMPHDAAVWHLSRSAAIMQAVALAVESDGGVMDYEQAKGLFVQADIHAKIGTGYATLAALPHRDIPDPRPTVVYPNG